MRAYDKEFMARVRARTELYNNQLEQYDALTRRAAAELVDRAVNITLSAIDSDKPCMSAVMTFTRPFYQRLPFGSSGTIALPFGSSGTIAYDRGAR